MQIINAQLEEALSNARTPHDFSMRTPTSSRGCASPLIDLDGTVVYDSNPPAEMSNHLDRPEVAAALTDGHGYTIRRQSENNGRPTSTPPPASATGSSASSPYTVSLSQVLNADRATFCGSWVQSPCAAVSGRLLRGPPVKNIVQMEATLAELTANMPPHCTRSGKIRIKRQLTNNIQP